MKLLSDTLRNIDSELALKKKLRQTVAESFLSSASSFWWWLVIWDCCSSIWKEYIRNIKGEYILGLGAEF